MGGFGDRPFGRGPFGPERGSANYSQTVTANMTWAASDEPKSISFSVSTAVDWSASVTKAVSYSVTASMVWVASVVKNVGHAVSTACSWGAVSVLKTVTFAVSVTMSWAGLIATLVQNIVDTTNIHKPINAILAGNQKYKEKGREWDVNYMNMSEKASATRSGVKSLSSAKPHFTSKTSTKGYD